MLDYIARNIKAFFSGCVTIIGSQIPDISISLKNLCIPLLNLDIKLGALHIQIDRSTYKYSTLKSFLYKFLFVFA